MVLRPLSAQRGRSADDSRAGGRVAMDWEQYQVLGCRHRVNLPSSDSLGRDGD
jgi:hypothetical protein